MRYRRASVTTEAKAGPHIALWVRTPLIALLRHQDAGHMTIPIARLAIATVMLPRSWDATGAPPTTSVAHMAQFMV